MRAGETTDLRAGATPARGRNNSDRATASSTQLSLFDADTERSAPQRIESPPIKPPPTPPPGAAKASAKRVIDEGRVLTIEDMPVYSDEAIASAITALKQLPHAQLWFTYKDVQFFFGVSRATVARRLREGLVPGITMAGENVVEDGPVRRFDREQLKWLLLALRHRRRQLGG
jgi:hypothetical protein